MIFCGGPFKQAFPTLGVPGLPESEILRARLVQAHARTGRCPPEIAENPHPDELAVELAGSLRRAARRRAASPRSCARRPASGCGPPRPERCSPCPPRTAGPSRHIPPESILCGMRQSRPLRGRTRRGTGCRSLAGRRRATRPFCRTGGTRRRLSCGARRPLGARDLGDVSDLSARLSYAAGSAPGALAHRVLPEFPGLGRGPDGMAAFGRQ